MSYIETESRDGALWLWLNRPGRHNALVPAMVSEFRAAVARAAEQDPSALVLAARGRSFSTGGDVAGFLENSGSLQALQEYSERLVGGLHAAILDLLAFPAPVLAAINGPVTGGSTGLMLAADLVAMAEDAFVQPYYSEVGFSPDGGWTALLPDRIGTAKALQIQYRNERIGATEALVLGLATCICPREQLESQIGSWTSEIAKGYAQTHRATREKIWDEQRRAEVKSRLDQEKARFLELVTRPETLEGMRDFKKERA
ncbi:enoyl-CoA hydratase/isomerase family protein [uncultured Roseibium sp.]|uniref:enoyl-CoA hydratase/isomerase family protein n=1 Tax=uncultured Roseibium sp. TaxID=1936171 RepID=UPI002633D308|nr:enoyl-CoA hydratase/isomerase family protein [uncultured Roseibium sp.]